MNRKYNAEEYKIKVDMLRKGIPDVSITTDIIVGFPGETAEEFNETYEFLNEISFSKMHIFKYSPRKGTPASKYPGQVDTAIKEERSNILLKLSNRKETEFNSKYIGRVMKVLFEQESKYDKNYLEGHTENFISVAANVGGDSINQITEVKLARIEKDLVIANGYY